MIPDNIKFYLSHDKFIVVQSFNKEQEYRIFHFSPTGLYGGTTTMIKPDFDEWLKRYSFIRTE